MNRTGCSSFKELRTIGGVEYGTFQEAFFEFKVAYSEDDYYEAYREQLERNYWDNVILEDDIITWTMENYFDNESEKDKKHISAELYLKEQLEISFELGHF
jgi:hypothetical protein